MEPVKNFDSLLKRSILFLGKDGCNSLLLARLLALGYDRFFFRAWW
jgi:hypothetical protein